MLRWWIIPSSRQSRQLSRRHITWVRGVDDLARHSTQHHHYSPSESSSFNNRIDFFIFLEPWSCGQEFPACYWLVGRARLGQIAVLGTNDFSAPLLPLSHFMHIHKYRSKKNKGWRTKKIDSITPFVAMKLRSFFLFLKESYETYNICLKKLLIRTFVVECR